MRPTDPARSVSARPVSRRTLIGSSLAAAAAWSLGGASARGAWHAETAAPTTWRTWALTSASELRPTAPAVPTPAELDELVALQGQRTDESIAVIRQWGGRPAILPWTDLANVAYEEFGLSPTRQYRANAILQAAMYDAVLAASDAQDAYNQPAPATLDRRIEPLEDLVATRPSFPSEHAAVAGAAAAVLTALLPDATAGRFTDLANEAAMTRLQAGVNVRRDIDAGLALGKAIGERAVALANDDRPGSDWDGSGRLTGPGYWQPTPPAMIEPPMEPLAGSWHCWVLTSGDQFRPAPPPAYGSPAMASQLAAVQEAVAGRTLQQEGTARFWQSTAASAEWGSFAADLIARHSLDLPHAARTMALTGIAIADAEVAAWDAKYTYWTARPITLDPTLDVLFPTPPFPSYPSAHATVSNAAAVVLAHLFPEEEFDLLALATQAAASRAWAGIHFPIDNDMGQAMGKSIGYLIVQRARADGAE